MTNCLKLVVIFTTGSQFENHSAGKLSNCFSQSNNLLYYQFPLWTDYCVLFLCLNLIVEK